MCLTCGCHLPYESHGDPKNITVADIKRSTATKEAAGETAAEAVKNLIKTWQKVKLEDKDYSSHKLSHMINYMKGK